MDAIPEITLDDMDAQEDIDALVAMMPDESSDDSDSDKEDKEESGKHLSSESSYQKILDSNEISQVEADNVAPFNDVDKPNDQRSSATKMEDIIDVKEIVYEIKNKDEPVSNNVGDHFNNVSEFHTDDMDSLEAINLLVEKSTYDSGGSENSDSDSDEENPIKTPIKSNSAISKVLDNASIATSETLDSPSVTIGDKLMKLDNSEIDQNEASVVTDEVSAVTVEEFGFQSNPTNEENETVTTTALDDVTVLPDNEGDNEATYESIAVLDEEESDQNLNSTSPYYRSMPTLGVGEQANPVGPSNPTLEQFKASQMASQMKRIIKDIDEDFSNEEMKKIIDDIDEAHSVEEHEEFSTEDLEGENVQDLLIEDCDKTMRERRYTNDYQYDENLETSDTDMTEDVEESDEDDEYEECEDNLSTISHISGPVTSSDMQSYQYSVSENLQEMLAGVETRLRDNLKRQDEIDSLIQDNGLEGSAPSLPSGRHVSVAKRTLTIFGAPYFKDHRLFSHPKNADTLKKLSNNELDVYITYPHCWTTAKRLKLAGSMREDAIKKRQKALIEKRENYTREIKDMGSTQEEKEQLRNLIQDIDKQLNEIAKLPDDKLFIDRDEDFDWMKISSQDFDEEFTAKGCELQWKNQLHPSINTGSFSKDEDELLKMLAQATEATDWDNIAKELGTGRTAIGCFMRYMEKHNMTVNNRRWERSEDERLRRIVASCRINNHIPWSKVSYYIENRTKDQCYQRYLYSLKDNLRQGTFAPAEDLLLIVGHKRHGSIWHKICETIPGRTPVQLHARWNAFLKVDFQSWTQEEDIQLLDLVHKNGMRDWVSIAKQMTGRTFTRMQVRNRFQFIVRNYRRNPDFTLDQIKYKNTPGIAGRRKDDIWKTMRDKFREWVQQEGLTEDDLAQADPTGSIQLVDDVIVGNTYCDKFVRYLQKFLPEPEEPRPLAALQAPLPRAVAHLKEDVLGPVGRTVSNKLKLARKKKKFKKLPVQKRREIYRNKLDRQIAEFLRCTWVGKGGRPKTTYNNEEIQQHTTAAIKLGQILDFSKLNLNHPYHHPPPDEPIEPKELALFSAYKYYRKYGKHQNRYDPETGLTTIAESPVKVSSSPPTALKTMRTYSRKNKKAAPTPQVPSEPTVSQAKEIPLKEGEKRLTLVPPNQASMIGFRGQLLHTGYLSSLANPDTDEETLQKSKTPSQTTMERMVQEGIYNSDLLLKIAEKNGVLSNVKNDGDEVCMAGVEPGTPTQKQADELLVKRFTQIFLLPALLSCKKPARQEQLFEESEFLNTEPVSAINPYDASDIIKGIEKPRVAYRKATSRQNTVVPVELPESAPSTSQPPPEVYLTPQSPQVLEPQPKNPEPSCSLQKPSQAPQTTVQHASTSQLNHSSPHVYASPQRPPQLSALVQKPLQTSGLRPSGETLPNNSSFQMTSKPQRYILFRQQPQKMDAAHRPQSNILQRPLQPLDKTTISPVQSKLTPNLPIPGPVRPSFQTICSPQLPRTSLPSCTITNTPQRSQPLKLMIHNTPKQSSFTPSQVSYSTPKQTNFTPSQVSYSTPKQTNFTPSQVPYSTPKQTSFMPSQIPYSTLKQTSFTPSQGSYSTPKQTIFTPAQAPNSIPKQTSYPTAQVPLQEESTDLNNRKRAALDQPVSDKDIPLKKRTFPPMRPPPPLSPNPATIAPIGSPKPTSLLPHSPTKLSLSPHSPTKLTCTSPPAFTSPNVPRPAAVPRLTPKGSKAKLSRTGSSVEVIHVFSGAQAAPTDPRAAVLNIKTGSPLCSQIKNTFQKQDRKDC